MPRSWKISGKLISPEPSKFRVAHSRRITPPATKSKLFAERVGRTNERTAGSKKGRNTPRARPFLVPRSIPPPSCTRPTARPPDRLNRARTQAWPPLAAALASIPTQERESAPQKIIRCRLLMGRGKFCYCSFCGLYPKRRNDVHTMWIMHVPSLMLTHSVHTSGWVPRPTQRG